MDAIKSTKAAMYWSAYDRANQLAQATRFNRHNDGAARYIEMCRDIPGWALVEQYSEKLRAWLNAMRSAAEAPKNSVDPRFISQMPHRSGGTVVDGFDSQKALAVLRADPELFCQVIGV